MNYNKEYLQAGYLFNKMSSQVAAGATFEKDAGIQEIWEWLQDMYGKVKNWMGFGAQAPEGAAEDVSNIFKAIGTPGTSAIPGTLAGDRISEEEIAAAQADMERGLSGGAEDVIMGGGETGTIPAALRAARQSPRQSSGALPFDLLSQMKKVLPPGVATPGLSVEDLPGTPGTIPVPRNIPESLMTIPSNRLMSKELPDIKSMIQGMGGMGSSLKKSLQDLESRPSMTPGGAFGIAAPSDYDIQSALNLWGQSR
jgi:hypothetical protein